MSGVAGLAVDVSGLSHHLSVGDRITLQGRNGATVSAEIVGFRGGLAQAMMYGPAAGLGPGARVFAMPGGAGTQLAVADAWIGRVLDPLGRPLDGRGPLPPGKQPMACTPPRRTPCCAPGWGRSWHLGMRVLNTFTTCRQGQRMGVFSGSGVGKSTLLAMLARHTALPRRGDRRWSANAAGK